ncbi:hypothetical protein FHU36_004686 [Nonomuraea muscovyensis]|uniref:Uncharacterized protein n=1 Tax=Nonomuraea muscovyensis TaxID=1124761 RepID=A0A7X0F0Y3_9ACTN|nr:hypothetical protein [Nonomuraea muscovyensis]MBB6348141.1 hypothetical protein [Nonomuraea muscovyensis]
MSYTDLPGRVGQILEALSSARLNTVHAPMMIALALIKRHETETTHRVLRARGAVDGSSAAEAGDARGDGAPGMSMTGMEWSTGWRRAIRGAPAAAAGAMGCP